MNNVAMTLTAAILLAAVVGQATSSTAADDRCATALQAAAKESRAASDSLTADAQYAEAHNGGFSPTMMQDYVRWYDNARSERPAKYPSLTATILTPAEEAQRQASVDEFLRFRRRRFEQETADRFTRTIAACPHRADELRAMAAAARRGN